MGARSVRHEPADTRADLSADSGAWHSAVEIRPQTVSDSDAI
jgi:hypothetical protein